MGMNIYTKDKRKHIGKRYAAGVWCWNCRVPMFDEDAYSGTKQYDNCPSCGMVKLTELKYNPAMRELGFDKTKPQAPAGIDGASGFIWCIDEEYGLGTFKVGILQELKLNHLLLIDEYGKEMTLKEFEEMFLQVIIEKFSGGDFT